MAEDVAQLGIVAIGRDEGERLRRCLLSIPDGVPVAYVDSASSDGSVEFARQQGAFVVELDLSRPFTAARARNEGLERLLQERPLLEFVQFVDGDCEIEAGWLAAAAAFLASRPDIAVVCGRRRERFPDASLYNRFCDEEWDTPVGEAAACGGDALMRLAALREVELYDPAMIAGEEPELCHRLRARGWRIWRLDTPMTIHDADMHRFRQWWLRAVRSGFGYAQVWNRTRGAGRPALYGREVARALFWTLGVAAAAGLLAGLAGPAGLLFAPLLWGAQFLRLSRRNGWRKAGHLLLGKAAEFMGIMRFAASCIGERKQGAIFYK